MPPTKENKNMIASVIAIAYKDIVNAADNKEEPAFNVKYEALKLYTNDAPEVLFACSFGLFISDISILLLPTRSARGDQPRHTICRRSF